MTTATEPATPLLFQPQRREHCPDDEGWDDPVYFFGEVTCAGCNRWIPVSAQIGKTTVAYCFFSDCRTQFSVAVDARHLRMDDSRPRDHLDSQGCVCGDARCRWWEVA